MQPNKQLSDYIYQQIQSGLQPAEVTQQLRTAGWDEASISAAFGAVQSHIQASQPPQLAEPAAPQATPATNRAQPAAATQFEPTGKKRGRLKTAWLLLKQSIKVLRNNKQLIKYPLMGGLISLIVMLIFGLIFFLSGDTLAVERTDIFGDTEYSLTPLGMLVAFVYYVIAYFVIFMYNAGLTAHTLDIFRGQSKEYKHYMQVAWSKRGPIFVYSVITTTVGLILRTIEERFRLLGFIIARVLGTLWVFANLFTVAYIVEDDISAPKAIKASTKLFISRWGESVAARITFGGLAFLLYLLVLIPAMIGLALILSLMGAAGIIVFVVILLICVIAFAIIESAASNILSTALYFYARYQQIPAAYDPALLNAVFIPKKPKRGLFGKKAG